MAATWRSPVGCTRSGQDVRLFRSWCKKRKVLWDSCDVQETATTGRAVVAAEDIAQDAVVVEVPDHAVLMGENCSIVDALAGDGCSKRHCSNTAAVAGAGTGHVLTSCCTFLTGALLCCRVWPAEAS
jgi:hypothetical protein